MDKVWLHLKKSRNWDLIVKHMKNGGYWGEVIRRTRRPTIEEVKHLKNNFALPPHLQARDDVLYEELLKQEYSILDMLFRKTDWGTDRYNSASIHELSSRIKIFYDFYKLTLIKQKITLVVFWNAPHMGWDKVLYEVAQNYNIRTLILDQSNFPNSFFHYFSFSDFGAFETSKKINNIEKYEIEKKFEKDWFYMKKNMGQKKQLSLKKLTSFHKYKKRMTHIIEQNDYLRFIREYLDPRRRPQSYFRFHTERSYKKELKKIISREYPFTNKYVYFPLHYQPEKVSSSWTGIYLDQILAIERLSGLIPDNWFIYVKENPKQKGAYRNKLFFDRLRLIPNLVVVPPDANTFKLTHNAQFVSTIVGTVGWEAITGGKNVLLFGWGAWYKTLPGVFYYRHDMDINRLLENKIDHDLLEKKTAWIFNRCGTGIMYDAYIPSLPNFSLEKNAETVAASLRKILY